jgi:endoglucanase
MARHPAIFYVKTRFPVYQACLQRRVIKNGSRKIIAEGLQTMRRKEFMLIAMGASIGTACRAVPAVTPPEIAEQLKLKNQLKMVSEAWRLAADRGWILGLRAVELIHSDILSVTLDGGITGTLDPTRTVAAQSFGSSSDYLTPALFSITSQTDPDYQKAVHPLKIGLANYEGRNTVNGKQIGWPLFYTPIYWNDFFLYLPKKLKSGHTYSIDIEARRPKDKRFTYQRQFTYHEQETTTKVIKINQVAYSALAKQRYAYLGWWTGNEGKVDYSDLKVFNVIDEKTGKSVLQGEIQLRLADDVLSGEDIYEMNISALKAGAYHLYLPGFACSETFHIGGKGIYELYYHTMRAFFHQRCGQALKEPWTWVKKSACHTEIWESGSFVAGPGAISPIIGRHYIRANYQPKPGEKKKSFKGGYHDAADFDTFIYHLPATSQILAVYETYPNAFADKDLDLPESGNGSPDILDEADWALSFYLDNQYANGAIPLGRGNLCDAFRQTIVVDPNLSKGAFPSLPAYGILPPANHSTAIFAAVAAQYSRLIQKYNAARAQQYLVAAQKAFEYASVRTLRQIHQEFSTNQVPLKFNEKQEQSRLPILCWAATELLLTTKHLKYNDFIRMHPKEMRHPRYSAPRIWAYLRVDKNLADAALQQQLRTQFLRQADNKIKLTHAGSYRMGNGTQPFVGWGAAQGINHAELLLRAYFLTQDQNYLDAACLNADWHLGSNPLSKTFITNMGYRFPNRPQISWFLYERPEVDLSGKTVKGYSIYGLGPSLKDWFGQWPKWRSWRDVWGRRAEIYSEFTVHQTIGPAAMLYATLYALEQQAGLIPPNTKPDPLQR